MQATGERQGAKSAKTATGGRQGGDEMATGERGGPNLMMHEKASHLACLSCRSTVFHPFGIVLKTFHE